MADVGLSVLEGVSNGLTPFVEASKDNIGALMERERGIPGKVINITSLQEDRVRFGGIQSNHYGAYFTRHLYNNVGPYGAILKGLRMYAGDVNADTAVGHFSDNSTSPTLVHAVVTPAGVSQGQVDSFTPGNVSIGDTFHMTVNGGDEISFTATAATVANVVAGLLAALDAYKLAHETSPWATNSVVGSNQTTYLRTTGADNVTMTMTSTAVNKDVIIDFYAGQEGQRDPGSWANTVGNTAGLKILAYPMGHPNGVMSKYLVEVYYKGVRKETYAEETWAKIVTQVNLNSRYVMAVPQNLGVTITGSDPDDIQVVTFSGGTYTEYDSIAVRTEAFKAAYTDGVASGAAIFDGEDIQLLVQTEIVTNGSNEGTDLAKNLRDYCAGRGDCMHPFILPANANDAAVAEYANQLQENTASFAAGYHVWVKTSDESGDYVWTPGLGQVIGAGYIRVPNMSRGFLWIPPAGVDSGFKDCIDITPNPLSQDKVNLYVKGRSCNVVQFKKGYGYIIVSSRTYSSNPLYHSVHIRRTTSWMVQTIRNNTQWAAQKPVTLALRGELISSLTMWMKGLWDNGALENNELEFSDNVHVICDKTNNPPTQDRKELNCDVEWIPTECSESVVIRLNRNDGVLITKYLQS